MSPAAVIPIVLAVVLMSAFIGLVIGYHKGLQAQADHVWEICGVHTPSGLFGPAQNITVVLSRCTREGCRELRTQQLDGVWTLTDILSGDAQADQDQAIRMVSKDGRP